MEKTFDHLLGLSARSALALLAGYGITDVRVTLTGAPLMNLRRVPPCPVPAPERVTALEGSGGSLPWAMTTTPRRAGLTRFWTRRWIAGC
jgi:hypothetical protein